MPHVDISRLRNVVLAGHTGSGKTTIAEHLLHTAGVINRMGRVDDGTASLDFEPEEQKRHLSLSLAVNTFDREGSHVTLIDTPGYADFVGEVISGFAAADGALITMDASGGVEAGTETAIRLGRATHTPAIFVITRCERENADPMAAVDALRERLRHEDRAAPGGHRQGRRLPRLRRPRPPHRPGSTRTASATRRRSPPSSPMRSRSAATSCSRPRPTPTTRSS